jgi:hypothetical protein
MGLYAHFVRILRERDGALSCGTLISTQNLAEKDAIRDPPRIDIASGDSVSD